ncbi:RNA polymerase sigma factor [Pseudopedobacter beijingensis]|uniref:RNA polymerase sigma factor n=1 Tax=Pseudopedobacter beijingensis TaxID=1207056 RepID=A0ABW4I903_9SPHI
MTVLEEVRQKELIRLLNLGNETAFNELYKIYIKPVYKKILFIVKEEEIAEELSQDLFIKIWQKRKEIDPEKSFKSFLYTIAHNLVYDYLRKVARDKQLLNSLMVNAVDYYLHTEEVFQARETQKILTEAIEKLPPQGKQVFTLCKLEGKSYEEVSRLMGITVATVNSHMVKSSRFVKEYLYRNLDADILMTIVVASVLLH